MAKFFFDRSGDFAVGLDNAEEIAETPVGSIHEGGESDPFFRLFVGEAFLVRVFRGDGLILVLESRSDGSLLVRREYGFHSRAPTRSSLPGLQGIANSPQLWLVHSKWQLSLRRLGLLEGRRGMKHDRRVARGAGHHLVL